jgi:hypothetical protein
MMTSSIVKLLRTPCNVTPGVGVEVTVQLLPWGSVAGAMLSASESQNNVAGSTSSRSKRPIKYRSSGLYAMLRGVVVYQPGSPPTQ